MYLIQYYVPLKPCTLNVRKTFKNGTHAYNMYLIKTQCKIVQVGFTMVCMGDKSRFTMVCMGNENF